MADNNTVELVVKVTDQATSPLKDMMGSLNELSRHVTGLDFAKFGTLAGVIGGAAEAINMVVTGSAELQDATFRLDNVFQAFSKTIGQSRSDLEEFSNSAREGSRFSNVEIIDAQQTLLKYGTITGETFKRAEQAALDLGAQLKDLGQASYILGRALAAPEQSARLLRQAGVVLTDQQKEQIKGFEDVGDKAGSANIILTEIEKRYSGTALKDLQTFTGAWSHLANTFKELFENTGVSTGMANVLNFLDKSLKDVLLLDQIAKMRLEDKAAAENSAITSQSGSFRGSFAHDTSTALSDKDKLKKIAADSALAVAELGQAMQLVEQNGSDLEKMKSDDESHTRSLGKAYDEATAEVEKFRKEQQQLTEDLANDPLDFSQIMSETQKMIAEQGKVIFKQMDQDEKDAERIHKNMLTNIQNIFANFFVSLKGGFKGLLSAFAEMLLQMVAQAAAADLTKALFGGSKESGGGGGLWGSLIGAAGAYFTGGASVAAGAGVANSGVVGPRASGGDTSGLTLVGEEGPELIATGSARVMNARQMAFAGGGGGGGTIHFAPVTNINMQPKDADAASLRTEFYSAMDMNGKKLKREVYDTLDRNGLGKMR